MSTTTTITNSNISTNVSGEYVWYQFEGNLINSVTGTADATLFGTASYNSSVVKRGTQSLLSNVNSYVNLPTLNLSYSSGLTIAFWFYRTGVGTETVLSFNSGGFEFYFFGSATTYNLCVSIAGGPDNSESFYTFTSINAWYHFAITMTYSSGNTSTRKIYIDGVLQKTIINMNYPTTTYSTNKLGQFTGYIDDFRIYRYVASDANITNIYNNNAFIKYPRAFNITSDVEFDSLIYATYPTLSSSSHVGMKSYMNNFPNGSVSLPSALPNSYMYLFLKSATGNVRATNCSNTAIAFFTGQHITLPDDTTIKVNLEENVGLIMSSNDTGCTSYNNLGPITGVDAIQINECLPNSTMSAIDNDPCVFGIVVDELNGSNSKVDCFMSDYESNEMREDIGESVRVNSLGEGAMWVSNINGAIKNGDLITTSRIKGVGKRQDDDFVYNYTVAKATMSCDFDLGSDKYKSKTVEFEGQTYIMAYIGVVYHCG